jgi:hypothetical protein
MQNVHILRALTQAHSIIAAHKLNFTDFLIASLIDDQHGEAKRICGRVCVYRCSNVLKMHVRVHFRFQFHHHLVCCAMCASNYDQIVQQSRLIVVIKRKSM